MTLRYAFDFDPAGLLFIDDFLRELAHETAADVFVDHRARAMGMTDMPVGCVMMPGIMTV